MQHLPASSLPAALTTRLPAAAAAAAAAALAPALAAAAAVAALLAELAAVAFLKPWLLLLLLGETGLLPSAVQTGLVGAAA